LGFRRIVVSGYGNRKQLKSKKIEVVFINRIDELPRAVFQ